MINVDSIARPTASFGIYVGLSSEAMIRLSRNALLTRVAYIDAVIGISGVEELLSSFELYGDSVQNKRAKARRKGNSESRCMFVQGSYGSMFEEIS